MEKLNFTLTSPMNSRGDFNGINLSVVLAAVAETADA